MFAIRRIYDDVMPANKSVLAKVQKILLSRFSAIDAQEVSSLGEKLRNPFKQRFRSMLFAAQSQKQKVIGFALVMHDPKLRFVFLDYLASGRGLASGGVGGALYEYVRDEAKALGSIGVFFECLPDDATQCKDPQELRAAKARLRFYENYGARPIVGTDYQRPIQPNDTCMPYLVYDGLDTAELLRKSKLKKIVRAVLERKYHELCPPEYVEAVVDSIRQDPVRLRDYRYIRIEPVRSCPARRMAKHTIPVVVNDKHDIHHVKDRGYVESPVRIPRILNELQKSADIEIIEPKQFTPRVLKTVHDADYVDYLERACNRLGETTSVYPYVFPIRNRARPPKELSIRAGYYCIDTFTPLNRSAWLAACRAVDCTLTAAQLIMSGHRLAYALVRPPGHHAEKRYFGGFCYFNNTALAAQMFSGHGRVAVLDIDYHHGNGQQDVFYRRSDVLTISLHGHPDFAYPYFSGFANERGEGPGEGYNLNIPLPEKLDGAGYVKALDRALRRICDYKPVFLIVALGFDTAKLDPTGSWTLEARDFFENGKKIGGLGTSVLVVQEGGYRTRTLGNNAAAFFSGLKEGIHW